MKSDGRKSIGSEWRKRGSKISGGRKGAECVVEERERSQGWNSRIMRMSVRRGK